MDKVIGRLTVFFEDPFWVGVFERIENGRLSAAKVTFGTEPKEPELLIYLLRHYYRRGGGNEDFFAVDSVDFDAGTVDAAMLRSRAVYLRALAEAEQQRCHAALAKQHRQRHPQPPLHLIFAALQRLFGLADALQRFPALEIELLPLFRQQLPSGGTLE